MNVLIDTNVILDALLARVPFDEPAQKLFIMAAEDKISACITANSVTDLHYLLHKYLRDDTQCRQALLKLFTLFNILDVTGADCEKALELPMPDYEDALLAVCAKRGKVDCIITRNLKDFNDSPVKAISPDDFLKSV
ncbi:MAG: PIN domain-containing protein [Syntrophomonadaceae bacterium]|nr:PIN domain-containing protein [Syntrophomonadaceae bacterium]